MLTANTINSLQSESVTKLLRHIEASHEFPQLAHYSLNILYKKLSDGSNLTARDDFLKQIIDVKGYETLIGALLQLGQLGGSDLNNGCVTNSDDVGDDDGSWIVTSIDESQENPKVMPSFRLDLQIDLINVLKFLISVPLGKQVLGVRNETIMVVDDNVILKHASDNLNKIIDVAILIISKKRENHQVPDSISFAYLELIHGILQRNERCRIGYWDKILDLAINVFTPVYLSKQKNKAIYEMLNILDAIIDIYKSKSFLFDGDRSRASLLVILRCLQNVIDLLSSCHKVSQ